MLFWMFIDHFGYWVYGAEAIEKGFIYHLAEEKIVIIVPRLA
jgi:hypothetical protein